MINQLIAPAAFGLFQVLFFTGAAWYFLNEFKSIDFPGNQEIARAIIVIIYAVGITSILGWIYWNL